jgi:hypothetical protein
MTAVVGERPALDAYLDEQRRDLQLIADQIRNGEVELTHSDGARWAFAARHSFLGLLAAIASRPNHGGFVRFIRAPERFSRLPLMA